MSREDGFAIADVDSSYFEDAKFRALWRRLNDEDGMARAVCVHMSTLLASWRHGERVTVQESAPLWLSDGLIPDLRAVGLLDDDDRIPEYAFDEWFGAANARRELRRTAGRAGGLASGKQRSTKRQPKVKQPFSIAVSPAEPDRTVRPSVPTVPSASSARAGLPNLDSAVAAVWEKATGRSVLASGAFVQDKLDDACRRHTVTDVCVAITRARSTFDHIPDGPPLMSKVLSILDPMPDRKAESKADAERAAREQSRRNVEATHRSNHKSGGHELEPRAGCPMCLEATA